MKVVHLALSGAGGAGIAARRSVAALSASGIDARLWVGDGRPGCSERALIRPGLYRFRARLDRLALRIYRRRRLFSAWSNNWLPSPLPSALRHARPDVLHCHWIGGGFVPLRELSKVDCPVVWSQHDAWAFTGGCHYPSECLRFKDECGKCPQLGSRRVHDLSWWNRRARRQLTEWVTAWVFPSVWLAELSVATRIVPKERTYVLPNGIDEPEFALGDRASARQKLGIPDTALVMAGGAADLGEPRKGFALLPEAVARIAKMTGRECRVVVFGRSNRAFLERLSVPVIDMGPLRPTEVATVFHAADLTLLPSLQDNLPNVAIESLACGCPVVGFNSGGFSEIIEQGQTGAIAKDSTAGGLAEAVVQWLATAPERQELAVRCRLCFDGRFAAEPHANGLRRIYENVLEVRRRR